MILSRRDAALPSEKCGAFKKERELCPRATKNQEKASKPKPQVAKRLLAFALHMRSSRIRFEVISCGFRAGRDGRFDRSTL